MGLGGGPNRYLYVKCAPTRFVDPTGTIERPSTAEIQQYEKDAAEHNSAVQAWHAELATSDSSQQTAARLDRERISLVDRENVLLDRWQDLAIRNVLADLEDMRTREYNEGNGDSWTLAGRTVTRLNGALNFAAGVAAMYGTAGLPYYLKQTLLKRA
ncbi:hypothetical protein [Nannocystis bainbridge]|uniref:hypothetical protein n=1 Tax=Nannocystis bainbridge TaxID=2995303 RepID=UPI00358DD57D